MLSILCVPVQMCLEACSDSIQKVYLTHLLLLVCHILYVPGCLWLHHLLGHPEMLNREPMASLSVSPTGPQMKGIKWSLVPLCHSSQSERKTVLFSVKVFSCSSFISHLKLRLQKQWASPSTTCCTHRNMGVRQNMWGCQYVFAHGVTHYFSPKQWIHLSVVWNFWAMRPSESILP